MRDDHALVGGRACGGEELGKLLEAEGGEDGGDVGVVGEGEVEGLVEGEGGRHAVEGDLVGGEYVQIKERRAKTHVGLSIRSGEGVILEYLEKW